MLVQGITGSNRRSKLAIVGHQLSTICIGGPTREYYMTLLLVAIGKLGLPLGLEAPVMTPNGVSFLFFLSAIGKGTSLRA